MTRFEIRTTTGKCRTVAVVEATTAATDTTAALRLLEDECKRRRISPERHAIRGWDPRRGWITHGGS